MFKTQKTILAKGLMQAFQPAMASTVSVPLLRDLELLKTARPKAPFNIHLPRPAKPEKLRPQKSIYNAGKPFVMVDVGYDTPTRGDTHGYIGLAQRLAEKIGAKLTIVDHQALLDRYPHIKSDHEGYYNAHYALEKRRSAFLTDEGCPDFYFTRTIDSATALLNKNGAGVIIQSINESLPALLVPSYHEKGYPAAVVPHHLSPETLAFEGRRFAEEFAELPRPFIAVNLVTGIYGMPEKVPKMLGTLAAAYEQATFFICTCHRTSALDQQQFMAYLRTEFDGLKEHFPIVEFDFNMQNDTYGRDNFWNIYKGMLDQADHIIQYGYSSSMLSEILATGKVPYVTDEYYDGTAKGYTKPFLLHEEGTPLETARFAPIDLNAECAEGLVQKLIEHKKVRGESSFKKMVKKDKNARYHPHFSPYRQI